jgi:murein DD-endopeptidase MepM/ murein hydrolase activator NlpD
MNSCFKGKFKVTSPRGNRVLNGKLEYHKGIDIVALGTDKTVYAVADGIVEATPYEKNGFGYYVRQLLPDGRRIYYAHLKQGSVAVKPCQKIKKGDKLGTMGATGYVTGAHTHIELRPKGNSSNSLDICEITGIPNKVGIYEARQSMTVDEACNILYKNGVMNTPQYWINTAPKVPYLEELIKNIAEVLKK